MKHTRNENNEHLRTLVKGARVDGVKLTQPKALLLFNLGLGPAGYSLSSWKAFFVKNPDSDRFRPFKKELLAHAEDVFGPLQLKPAPGPSRSR